MREQVIYQGPQRLHSDLPVNTITASPRIYILTEKFWVIHGSAAFRCLDRHTQAAVHPSGFYRSTQPADHTVQEWWARGRIQASAFFLCWCYDKMYRVRHVAFSLFPLSDFQHDTWSEWKCLTAKECCCLSLELWGLNGTNATFHKQWCVVRSVSHQNICISPGAGSTNGVEL